MERKEMLWESWIDLPSLQRMTCSERSNYYDYFINVRTVIAKSSIIVLESPVDILVLNEINLPDKAFLKVKSVTKESI